MRGFGRRASAAAPSSEDDPFERLLDGADARQHTGRASLDEVFGAFDSQELLAPLREPTSSPPSSPPPRRLAANGCSAASPSASMALYDCISALVRAGRSPISAPKQVGRKRPLPERARQQHPDVRARIVQLLDEQGADPDYHAWQCEPLLYHVLMLTIRDPEQSVEIARLLLDRGADALARATDGRSMLDVALDMSDGELVKELLSYGALPTARPLDAFGAPVQQLMLLARSHGFEAETAEALDAALADAVEEANVPLARALLWHGARANATVRGGGGPVRSVLHAALGARTQNLELVALLLRSGADPAPVDARGNSALWMVALRDDGQALALLLASGAVRACGERDEAMGASVREYCCSAGGSTAACRAAFERFDEGAARPAGEPKGGPARTLGGAGAASLEGKAAIDSLARRRS